MIDNATDASIGIVVADDDPAAAELLAGTLASLSESGVAADDIYVSHVPTVVELPFAARQMAIVKEPSAVIMLGWLVGEPASPQFLSQQRIVDHAVAHLNLRHEIPFIDGVGRDAGRGDSRRRGAQCAAAALQMANMMASLINS